MEMMERSTAPVVFSHSNRARSVTTAATSATIRSRRVPPPRRHRINGVGAFLGDNDISAKRMVEHIDYVVQLVGARHAGLGSTIFRMWRRCRS